VYKNKGWNGNFVVIKMKQISLKKEKERLKKEIYELQAKTGKIYIN